MTTRIDDDQAMREVTERLAARFPDRTHREIRSIVDQIHEDLGVVRVPDFVPLLVEKAAARRLKG